MLFFSTSIVTLINITDPVDATGSFTKGLLSRRGILLMIEFSFKRWTAASRNTKPISLKQLHDWISHRNKIVCVYVPARAPGCLKDKLVNL